MEAPEWGHSYSRQASTKRSWGSEEDENVFVPRPSPWTGLVLPPIEESLSRQHSLDSRESMEDRLKRPKIEVDDSRASFRDDTAVNGSLSTMRSCAPYDSHRNSSSNETTLQPHQPEMRGGQVGPAAATNLPTLCLRCRRLATDQSDAFSLELSGVRRIEPNDTSDAEMILVTQAAAAALTKILQNLNAVMSCVPNGVKNRTSISPERNHVDLTNTTASDLKESLDRILERIRHVNELASELVQQVKSTSSQTHEQTFMWHGSAGQDELYQNRKRHLDSDPDDGHVSEGSQSNTDAKAFTRRRSDYSIPNPRDLPPTSFHQGYHASAAFTDGSLRQPSIMNPPPAPSRALPLSPGRSLPSPISANFPSPSIASYGSGSQVFNLPPPGSHTSSHGPQFPLHASSTSSDAALQAHTAALQHEVSTQKIALSSLQSEHDKLLAALSRSKLRANALEKKHVVADTEIINLSEDRIRLQNQVTELERDVEELTRSRDDARQSAVREASQYVEIVSQATKLEQMAMEERKTWEKLKAEMEVSIAALSHGPSKPNDGTPPLAGHSASPAADEDNMEIDAAHTKSTPEIKTNLLNPTKSQIPPSSAPTKDVDDVLTNALRAEIKRLRIRCAEVELTLKLVREESRSVHEIVRALGVAQQSIIDRADGALADGDNDIADH